MICDPDYINQHLLDYMTYREKLYADTKRTYMYSATYEGFVKMIKLSESVSDLQQMRYVFLSSGFHCNLPILLSSLFLK